MLKGNDFFFFSEDPDTEVEPRCDEDVATPEQVKTPAVTQIAVRVTEPVPLRATAGAKVILVFCSVLFTVTQTIPLTGNIKFFVFVSEEVMLLHWCGWQNRRQESVASIKHYM
jgi:hypothetical protein